MSAPTAEFLFGLVMGALLIGMIACVLILYVTTSPWNRVHETTRDQDLY